MLYLYTDDINLIFRNQFSTVCIISAHTQVSWAATIQKLPWQHRSFFTNKKLAKGFKTYTKLDTDEHCIPELSYTRNDFFFALVLLISKKHTFLKPFYNILSIVSIQTKSIIKNYLDESFFSHILFFYNHKNPMFLL